MPKKSERRKLIDDIEQELILRKLGFFSEDEELDEDNCDHLGDDDDDLWRLYTQVQSNRYLEPREHVARAPERLNWLLLELDDKRFKQEVRVTKAFFQELLVKIEDHHIFQNKANKKQRPVHHQLLVAMKRFGTHGNGAAVGAIARYFALSGMVFFLSSLSYVSMHTFSFSFFSF